MKDIGGTSGYDEISTPTKKNMLDTLCCYIRHTGVSINFIAGVEQGIPVSFWACVEKT